MLTLCLNLRSYLQTLGDRHLVVLWFDGGEFLSVRVMEILGLTNLHYKHYWICERYPLTKKNSFVCLFVTVVVITFLKRF